MKPVIENTPATYGQGLIERDSRAPVGANGGGTAGRAGEPLKALSIMQPWAWLIVNGHKDIENRDWRCHRRGPVLIHAGKKVDRDAIDFLRRGFHPVVGVPIALDVPETFETGGIVGEATIAGCVTHSASSWFVGRFGILMRYARPLPFQPCNGALGFFVPPLAPAHTLDIAAVEA